MPEEKRQFWGLVELMGHQKLAGLVTEVELGGAKLLRVDVPEVPAKPAERWRPEQPAIPAYSRFVGGAALYALMPMTEDACRAALAQYRIDPVNLVGMAHIVRQVVTEAPKQIAGVAELDEDDRLAIAASVLREYASASGLSEGFRTFSLR